VEQLSRLISKAMAFGERIIKWELTKPIWLVALVLCGPCIVFATVQWIITGRLGLNAIALYILAAVLAVFYALTWWGERKENQQSSD
jgi:hypothetical protein